MTLSSWIHVAGSLQWRTIIAKGTSWKLQGWANTLKFVSGVHTPGDIGVYSGVTGRKVINDGCWHHVAGVYDGRTATLYIDGRRNVAAAASGSIPANSSNLWIGWDSHRTEEAWNGRIDDVRIDSYALSPEEVRLLCKGKEPPQEKKAD